MIVGFHTAVVTPPACSLILQRSAVVAIVGSIFETISLGLQYICVSRVHDCPRVHLNRMSIQIQQAFAFMLLLYESNLKDM